jgi:hypothetical protein
VDLDRAGRETLSAAAAAVTERPAGSMISVRIKSPGCGGFFIGMFYSSPPNSNRRFPALWWSLRFLVVLDHDVEIIVKPHGGNLFYREFVHGLYI